MTGKDKAPGTTAEVSSGASLISDAKLRQLYTNMVHCRLLAEYAAGLRFKPGSVNPYAASPGQEAIAAGWVTDLQPGDTIALASQDAAPALIKGLPLPEAVALLQAIRRGAAHPGSSGTNVLPASEKLEEQCVAIAATAFANKRKAKTPVVVAFASTAATALAPWNGLVTKAAKKKLPIAFVVENNPWDGAPAGSIEDFTQKARGYGLTGISVDGNDVVAVYRVAHESLERVRHGDGPVMVEATLYSESDRGKPKRSERDPLLRMERYLKAKKLFSPKWKAQVFDEFVKDLKHAAKAGRALSA